MPAQTVIKLRRDTAANWTSANPVLALGEPGLETDTGRLKFGDGSTAWTALGYGDSSTVAAPITLTGSEIGFDEVAAAKLEAPELTAVQNDTGSIVAKGAAVYISGANGDNALISLAQADTEATSTKTFGLVYEEIPIGGQGYVVTFGRLSGLNTDGIAAGSAVWLSPTTAGGLIYGAPPVTPNHMVFIGYVIRSQLNNGEIFVEVQNGYELSELHDVLITSVATGEVIQWDGSKWVNAQLDGLPSQTGETGKYLTTDGTTASWGDVVTEVTAAIVDSAPATLDTLNELAAALGDDPNFATTVTASLSGKSDTGHTHLLADVTDVTATATELNYVDGVTSDIQGQIDGKASSSHTHLIADITDVTATATELNYVDGVTSAIQTQLDGKAASTHTHLLADVTDVTATATELNYVAGVTSSIQDQIDNPLASFVTDATTARTLTSSDMGKTIRFTSGSPTVVTVNASTDFTVGARVDIIADGAGELTVTASGATVAGAETSTTSGSFTVGAQYSSATLLCVATDEYRLIGNVAVV